MDERLKKLRKKLDLTQREFAEKLHIKQNTVATYEMGRIIPSDSVVAGICREFNVNEEWLRTGTGEMFIEETPDEKFMRMAKAVAAGDTRADRMIRKTLMCFYEMDDLGKEKAGRIRLLYMIIALYLSEKFVSTVKEDFDPFK